MRTLIMTRLVTVLEITVATVITVAIIGVLWGCRSKGITKANVEAELDQRFSKSLGPNDRAIAICGEVLNPRIISCSYFQSPVIRHCIVAQSNGLILSFICTGLDCVAQSQAQGRILDRIPSNTDIDSLQDRHSDP
jgi:hypothetical protein